MTNRLVNYFKNQFQWKMFCLEHHQLQDFYISSWQRGNSCLPLLFCRGFLFLFSLGVLVASMITFGQSGLIGYFFIYMTNWGLIFLTLTNGFSTSVSFYYYFRQDQGNNLELPWFVRMYWLLYNATIPTAFMITIFYWSLLSSDVQDFALNPIIDILVHGINAAVAMAELLLSGHPSHILHFIHPVLINVLYILFTVIYYFAEGYDGYGNRYIYPVIDWSQPGPTGIVVAGTALAILLLHCLVVAIAETRDALARKLRAS